MSIDLRQMALDSVLEYDRTGQKLDAIVHEKLNQYSQLEPVQKNFYVRLTQGTVENRIRLDYRIAVYSNTPLKKIRPVLLWILRLAAYQIEEMTGTPQSAVVNEAVKMAEARGFGRLKGFVNAVLRNMIRYPEKVNWPKEDEPVRYISVLYSVPVYLAEKFIQAYGFEKTKEVFASFAEEKPLAVHIKTTDNDVQKTVESLERDGAEVKKAPWPQNAYYLTVNQEPGKLTAFSEGAVFVQDISSQLAVSAAGIRKEDAVLDVCAAPGGKSLLAADLLCGTGKVVSRDVSKNRVKTLRENIARMGFENISAEEKDALEYDERSCGQYDVVLVDAPCSGYGVIGRKPDIKYTASAQKEEELAALQRKILHNAAAYVKPGGTLVYSTCTISEKENEENAKWFVKEHDFTELPLGSRLPKELECRGNMLQLLPDNHHDGFFIAAFKKKRKADIRSLYPDELGDLISELGEKPFRAKQLFSWMHEKQARSYEEMTNLSKTLREKLENACPLRTVEEVQKLVSQKDGTEKYLFRLYDGNVIESVLMRYDYGNSVCVSSQAGCAMGCLFCASTKKGLERSLSASEMLGQVYAIGRSIRERISHVVIMGMGEPLANYDSTVRFIRLLSHPDGYGLSQRNITISTCGLVPEIRKLAEEDLSVTLAISLHASNDEKRRKLMPVARKYSIPELMDASRYYFEKTGRRVSFEYALIAGENDSEEDARQLSSLLKGFPTHLNLIPVNSVAESGLAKPGRNDVQEFYKKLEKYGINVTIRKEMGSDINGACGQLRNSYISVGEDSFAAK